jgi:hypothetical protein
MTNSAATTLAFCSASSACGGSDADMYAVAAALLAKAAA